MLEVENLTARYPRASRPVIDGLSFSLGEGGLLALLGPSGCGKTTLLNLLAGVLPPTGGSVRFCGAPLSPRDTAIGLIPQNYGLLPWKTVRENCLFCARLRGASGERELDALCARLGIGGLLDRYPRELSGGQAQRAALARALLMKPRLLLMDEPFAALDAAAADRARRLCFELWRDSGATAVVVTHRPEEALYLAGQIAVMGKGGRFTRLLENPWQGLPEPGGPYFEAFSPELRREILLAAGEEAAS
ncbi:ATP-binding cassette domain-containing protein [Anaerotruncus massiliensis (ex Liu et al. 2021)]|uniref:ATP-binding cassette domain-containing protein n=1 Tax=Anaerotruncus massiliensis (ex Liu et al. 2021) TaxID=2321404 RepID=UPI003AB20FEA